MAITGSKPSNWTAATIAAVKAAINSYEILGLALSDQTTALTTGEKIALNMPFDLDVTRVYATAKTAPVGSNLQFDVEDGGTSILNAVLEIAASGTYAETSTFASSATHYQLHKNDLLSVDIDQIGSSTAGAGAVIFLEGWR
jgi:hypothetical protein